MGKALWTDLKSVKAAATRLMAVYPNVPSLQAHRYAAGLSQDQAAARYNEVTGNQTTLGGTTINAWESWARGRGQGSPPTMAGLLVLCNAYGRGPLGIMEEAISPMDLIAEAYERLPIEDQLALRQFATDRLEPSEATSSRRVDGTHDNVPSKQSALSQVGDDFTMTVPTVEYGNSEIDVFCLPNPKPGRLLDLTWETFGYGVERLAQQIKNLGKRLDVDACFGVNEAGLVMATFLSSSQFLRCPIGYLRCNKIKDGITLDEASHFPHTGDAPTIMICDFEVKHADVIGYLTRQLRERYPRAEVYFAVFGAMTKDSNLAVDSFDDLTGATIMHAAEFEAIFVAATMSPPGIEPPLELR